MTKVDLNIALKPPFAKRYDNYIGGEWRAPHAGKYFDNISPITGQPVCEIARSDASDVEAALDAAHAAKDAWGRTSPAERALILNRIADRMEENLDLLAHLLDDWFRLPGTSIRFGLDGIIGLIPGLGDVLAGLASCIIIIAAWFRGVPYVGLARMVVNLGIDVIVGAIPLFGDAFDIAWKANRRNYALMLRHLHQPRVHTWKDYVFLLCIAVVLLAIFVAPIIVIVWLMQWLFRPA